MRRLLVAPPGFAGATDRMGDDTIRCVLLADRHHGVTEGVRSLLETTFEAVVMVADEVSLFESARRLRVALAVVDLSLTRKDGPALVRRLRGGFPDLRLIVVSTCDDSRVCRAALEAGANGFILRHAIANDLLPAVDAVLAGNTFVSPGILPP